MKTKSKVIWKQLTVRVPVEVHRALKVRAAEDGQSVAVIIEGLVREYLVLKRKVNIFATFDAEDSQKGKKA